MKNNYKPWAFIFCFVILSLQGQKSFAQFVEFGPIHRQKFADTSNFGSSRLQNTNALPFWDDFSKGLDTLKWTIDGASYTETIGQNAPSLGAILFNGVDENGRPYSNQIGDQGESDYLTSKPFDLSTLTQAQKESLYLSFFWQAGGNAEAPDTNDRLTLQIFSPNQEWVNAWEQNGGSDLDRTIFTQEIIKILPEWQHDGFQFRFLSSGRQIGPFDSWLIDYLYFNFNRTENDLTYRDRALTLPNLLNFGDFSAYPLELLPTDQSGFWSPVQNEFLNLEDRFRAMEFSIQIEDSLGNPALIVNDDTPFNPVPNSLERRTFLSREFNEIPRPTTETTLVITSSLTSGDGLLFDIQNGDTTRYSSVDYRINDTVKTTFPLRDFFAYDNGSADYSAGINQRSGQLAVAYNSPESVYLKGISINFTNASQANQPLDIVVWDEIDQQPIFSKESSIPEKIPGQDFIYYPLDTNLRVSGTFFIGFTQFSNDFIHVGLDKVNDRGDKIFYNVGGAWAQNEEVKGALMIRPHVSLAPPFEESLLPDSGFRIYPNPVVDRLFVQGQFVELAIFDSFGRQILLPIERVNDGEIVNFEGQKPGIYVINLISGSSSKSFRILVTK
ncbi:Por secretion system C-terminal sorting domain-containing protein [Algoriphagus boritolerans DSM 17298 = JCM 18970]|uniref:Por secretion system C-terminal sorting domain-containing protein n=1 Tax=Algoriphagus boritolerans DSM 17298 = JCM 18970 TaxID=1120964 RepID=A0A1H5VJH7_9BACT|nr:Por secretion system C-terminal sorting domain-containing protein [Algoriphagus boritolerans DSM 17298 = JCM 18970]